MTEDKSIILDFTQGSNLMSTQCECPQCGNKYLFGVPYVTVPCKKCGIKFNTDFKQDMYTKKARQINSKISFYDKITLRFKEEDEGSLIHYRQHLLQQKCWIVSEITHKGDEYKRCLECGVCLECYHCKTCNKNFAHNDNRRKQVCPECGGSDFEHTYFKKVAGKTKKVCPHCKSEKIKMTITRNKKKCHLCESDNLSEARTRELFEFSVERKEAYKI